MASTDQRRSRHHDESPTKPNKKKASHNPEKNLFVNLHSCSKSKDLSAALALYDGAITSTDIRLSQQHFQTLLYLCSASISDPSLQTLAIDRGFQIFDRMVSSGISPNESSVTAVARLAAAKGDGDYAFKKRVNALLENPNHGNLVEEWINNNVLYATPPGSNDDWYWLYAAAKLKCLLVTNDEMRGDERSHF